MSALVSDHLRASEGFSRVAEQADGRWDRPSPCTEWDARGVVEHVIGFHDVLILRPRDAKPKRPREDPVARWSLTVAALSLALPLTHRGINPSDTDLPEVDLGRLLPMLTTDVLVHTWDLAQAIGCDAALDPELSAAAYLRARQNEERLRASGMFAPSIRVSEDEDIETKLVAFLGRDPAWNASLG